MSSADPVLETDLLIEPFYEAQANEVDVLSLAFKQQMPVILKGPTGCGKSRLIEKIAFDFKRPLVTVSCNEDTSATELIGRYLVRGLETLWCDGPLTRAVREGGILYLDEVVEAREDVLVLIHSLTDHRRSLFIDATGEALKAPKNFMLVMSYNPGYQRSFKELKASTKQRFISIQLNYPDAATEVKIIEKETGATKSLATKLVALANKIRPLSELSLSESVSTRLLVYASKLIQSGMNAREAAQVAIVNPLTDDFETAQALKDLAALHL